MAGDSETDWEGNGVKRRCWEVSSWARLAISVSRWSVCYTALGHR